MSDKKSIEQVKSKNKKNMRLPDHVDVNEVTCTWDIIQRMSQNLEDNHGYTRESVLHGILTGMLSLNFRRRDQRLIRNPIDQEEFLKHALKIVQDSYNEHKLSEHDLDLIKEKYGNDMMGFRDAKNYGWNCNKSEE